MNRVTPALEKILSMFSIALMVIALFVLPLMSNAVDIPTGDPDRGKVLFDKRCTGCHSLDQDKEGPRLRSVYGRHAGAVPTFTYSDALKAANLTWDDASLDKWLTDTDSLVPDNDMTFRVPKADERSDIIRYLKLSSGK